MGVDLSKSPLSAGKFRPTAEDLKLGAAMGYGEFWCHHQN